MQRARSKEPKKSKFDEEVLSRIKKHHPNQSVMNSEALLLIDRITNAYHFLQVLSLLDDEGKKSLLQKSKAQQWKHVHDEALAQSHFKLPLHNPSGAPYPNEHLRPHEKFFILIFAKFGKYCHLYPGAQIAFMSNNRETVKSQYMIAPMMWAAVDPVIVDNIASVHINLTNDIEQLQQVARLMSCTENRVDYVKKWGNFWIPRSESKMHKLAAFKGYLSCLAEVLQADFLARNSQNTSEMLAELSVSLEQYGSVMETQEDMEAVQSVVKTINGADNLIRQYCKRFFDIAEDAENEPYRIARDLNSISLRSSFELRCYSNLDAAVRKYRK